MIKGDDMSMLLHLPTGIYINGSIIIYYSFCIAVYDCEWINWLASDNASLPCAMQNHANASQINPNSSFYTVQSKPKLNSERIFGIFFSEIKVYESWVPRVHWEDQGMFPSYMSAYIYIYRLLINKNLISVAKFEFTIL